MPAAPNHRVDRAFEPSRSRRALLGRALDAAAARFERTPTGERSYGYQGHSVGTATTTGEWLHVRVAGRGDEDDVAALHDRVAEADARIPPSFPRPRTIAADLFSVRGADVYASLDRIAPGRAASRYSCLVEDDPAIDRGYVVGLRSLTDALAAVPDAPADGTLDRWLGDWVERCGQPLERAVDLRVTGHGDFHWGNFRLPDPHVVDWEYWGRVPVGYDAAQLLVMSLVVPRVAALVADVFADQLATPDGRRSQVLWCHIVLQARRHERTFRALAGPALGHLTGALGEPAPPRGRRW